MDNRTKFLLAVVKIKRNGIEDFLNWLKGTDFFKAPASTKFHGAYEGGLLEHSLNVYINLKDEVDVYNRANPDVKISEESVIIASLFHDVCKANFYSVDYRNKKNEETNQWYKEPYYTVNDQFPLGHGEKSAYLIERYMRLTEDELMAIRWHMGGFDDSVKGGSYTMSNAYEKYPLAVLLHIADLKATYLDENRDGNKA